jgi:hypothetical protein
MSRHLASAVHSGGRLIWAQRRVVGWHMPVGSALLLAVAAAIILDQSDQPLYHFQLVCELSLPLVSAVACAYLFSPENDPPLELLYACPPPIPILLGARWVWLAAVFVLSVSGVQVAFLAANASSSCADLWLLGQIWLPPALCLGGLGLLVTQGVRSAQAGVLVGVMVWLVQVLMLARTFAESQVLRSVYLFPILAGLPMDEMTFNRWLLVGLGGLFFSLGVAAARDPQRHWNG